MCVCVCVCVCCGGTNFSCITIVLIPVAPEASPEDRGFAHSRRLTAADFFSATNFPVTASVPSGEEVAHLQGDARALPVQENAKVKHKKRKASKSKRKKTEKEKILELELKLRKNQKKRRKKPKAGSFDWLVETRSLLLTLDCMQDAYCF